MTTKTNIPMPVVVIYAVSKHCGLVPTSPFSEHVGGYVNLPPVVKWVLDDPTALAKELSARLSATVAETDISFEETLKLSTMEDALNAKSMEEIEKKTVYIDIALNKGEFNLQIFGRSDKGTWLDAPYAVDVRMPAKKGFDALAKVIVDHLKSRKDLPDEPTSQRRF